MTRVHDLTICVIVYGPTRLSEGPTGPLEFAVEIWGPLEISVHCRFVRVRVRVRVSPPGRQVSSYVCEVDVRLVMENIRR